MSGAYAGNPGAARELAARLDAHAQADTLLPGAFSWNGKRGSLVGCMLQSDDTARWESELGLPPWLAPVADKLAEGAGSAAAALSFGVRLIEAIRPGSELVPLGSRFILALLSDLQLRIAAPAGTPARALADVERLHRGVADGQPPAIPEWRTVRRAATAATDEVQDPVQRALSTCAETAAWNPAGSPSAVYDTMRTWAAARKHLFASDNGWRDDYEAPLRARLKELYDTYLKDDAELRKTVTVFQLMAEHYPEEDRLVRLKNRIDMESDQAAYADAAEILLKLLQAA